jgi:hypothetical protein
LDHKIRWKTVVVSLDSFAKRDGLYLVERRKIPNRASLCARVPADEVNPPLDDFYWNKLVARRFFLGHGRD